MKKVISPVAINALSDALTNIYWYKSELRSFITNIISDQNILIRLNWGDYKRNIVSALMTLLSKNQEVYQNDLLRLMTEVCKMEDFSHLERLDGGKEKARAARQSVEALKKHVAGHVDLVEELKKQEERRKSAYEKSLKIKDVQAKLNEIKLSYYTLISSTNHQARGFALEKIIKELFSLFDLDPKAAFRIEGEQIDGAFTFENTDYLFEAKWEQSLCDIQDLDAFSGKLSRKLDNTLGLFCSINGFSENAVRTHSTGRRLMILMDGSDLMAVLEGRIDLIQLLLRKRRHASQTGNIYLKIHEVLTNE
jgi:hypothetical protein